MPELDPAGGIAHGKIAILGSGREGLAALDYLREQTGELPEILTEKISGTERELELQASGVLKVVPFGEARLDDYDLLVRSPGVSRYRASLQRAEASGTRITTPSNLWFKAHPGARTIVISGTKGKSTTAALLAHLLGGTGVRVQLGGNIGTPLLACDATGIEWWVIELSSFQLADLEGRPTIGVLLNLAADHLDWHGSEAQYRQDKLRLAQLVEAGGLLANRSDPVLRNALAGRANVHWFEVDQHESGSGGITMPASLPGRHNRENLAACLAVVEKLGQDRAGALAGLASFRGLPHRLQIAGEADGVTFINDSISTAPIATAAALEAMAGRAVVLLVGGFDRGIDWAPYAKAFLSHPPRAVIGMPDNGPRILAALEHAGLAPECGMLEAEDLAAAVTKARAIVPAGGVVLLSPGAPSFPHFRDYADRGERFLRLCGFSPAVGGQ